MAYVYLIVASAFQLAWLYNIKQIKKERFKGLRLKDLLKGKLWIAILPIILYVLFGISNVVFLTMSMKTIPATFAYAVWTGIVIGISSLIDQLILKIPFKPVKYVFLGLILMGIIGLKYSTPAI